MCDKKLTVFPRVPSYRCNQSAEDWIWSTDHEVGARACDTRPCDFGSTHIGYDATNFVSRFYDTGSVDLSFNAARLEHDRVFDVIPQPDGKCVAVGQRVSKTSKTSQLIVFLLQPNGLLDTSFGNDGIVELSVADHGQWHVGTNSHSGGPPRRDLLRCLTERQSDAPIFRNGMQSWTYRSCDRYASKTVPLNIGDTT
jgi:hypothetical protein